MMSLPSTFHLSPDVAAETGIHIADGGLSIKRGGPHGSYQYEVTGHALEDQLYLIGTVMPTISAAYHLQRPGLYINPEQTWISLRYQSKAVALFKHETLGLPNGRKRNLSIPEAFRSDARDETSGKRTSRNRRRPRILQRQERQSLQISTDSDKTESEF